MRIHVLAAATLLAASFSTHAATDDPFVVHEWGTFTTAQGSDAEQIAWSPPFSVDLPQFVYSGRGNPGGFRDAAQVWQGKNVVAPVRLETPVIYFYSQQERVADVRVVFRGGNISEWYPQATNLQSLATGAMPAQYARAFVIDWAGVRILPRDTREMSHDALIRAKDPSRGSHYYTARETDANFLRVSAPKANQDVEHERHLFYRGVAYFKAPLSVGIDADEQQVFLAAREAEPISDLFVVTIRKGMMRYQKLDRPATSATAAIVVNTQPFGALNDVRPRAMQDMAAALVDQGLYEKEAQAMVKTWQDQWFAEEGMRVLYLLPRAWTDRTLQLQVVPRPDSVARVMVGRAEIITPSDERKLRDQALTFIRGDDKTKARIVANIGQLGLGRFLNAAIWKVGNDRNDSVATAAVWQLNDALMSARDEGARSARN
ncbi:MAG TPA: hypothetical protein VJT80_25800 [Steroidobacteraceae bacterium]|nr:hypothetical protein [Steroidobacteraceae bacterium]